MAGPAGGLHIGAGFSFIATVPCDILYGPEISPAKPRNRLSAFRSEKETKAAAGVMDRSRRRDHRPGGLFAHPADPGGTALQRLHRRRLRPQPNDRPLESQILRLRLLQLSAAAQLYDGSGADHL